MPIGFGPVELFIILLLVVIVFGAGKLSDAGSALGKSIRDFRAASKDEADPTSVSRG